MSTYRRILLKLSGEILASDVQNIDSQMLNKVVNIVKSALNLGVEVAIVIGGGNICVYSMLDDSKALANILSGKVAGTTVSQHGD